MRKSFWIGICLSVLLGVSAVSGQGPTPAVVQQAIRQLLASNAVVSGNWTCTGTCTGFGGGGTPGGMNTQVQFNDSGAFGGDSGLTFNKTTDALDLGAAGVRQTPDGDGALTFLGLGNGSDEDLTFNFDDVANTVGVSSSTGVTNLLFASIGITVPAVVLDGATKDTTITTQTDGLAISSTGAYVNHDVTATAVDGFDVDINNLSGDGYLAFTLLTTDAMSGTKSLGLYVNGDNDQAQLFTNTVLGLQLLSQAGPIEFSGTNEDLIFAMDAVANTVGISSSTGVLKLDFGTIILEGKFNSSDGTAGVTVATCTGFKDGLCISGT